ncbi:MAG: four helix bundle protein [Chitinivibrionales bacterium]|nr:four helix bundle protein [Chitinivibrionales bacterium]
MREKALDLEQRLIDFSAEIINIIEELPQTRAGCNVAGQLIRSGTSPAFNNAEAQSAKSIWNSLNSLLVKK